MVVIKSAGRDEAHIMKMKNSFRSSVREMKGRNHWEELDIDGRKILN